WEDLEDDEEYEPTAEQMEEHARAVREAAVPEMRYYAALAVNHGLCKPTIERAQGAGGCASGVITQRLVAAGQDPTRAEAAQERRNCDLVREIFPNPFRTRSQFRRS